MTQIGFIGLGTMGSLMSKHLLRKNYDLIVHDVVEEAMQPVVDAGARPAENPAELAERADVVLLSLPKPEHVEEVVFGGLDSNLSQDDIVVDLTTSRPSTTERITEQLADQGIQMIGAPVSRGKSAAEEGTLAIMAGGDSRTLDRVRPVLEVFATDIIHVGDEPAHGHAAKLLNNYLSFSAMLATSEAAILGQEAGLALESLIEVFNMSSGRNSATVRKFPNHVVTGTYDAGFPMQLVRKDLRLFAQFGDEYDVPLLFGQVVYQLIQYAHSELGEEADQTRIYDFFSDMMNHG